MKLYIQIKDNKPVGHPIFEDNFCAAFPHIDVNNLPAGFAKFERTPATNFGPYYKNHRSTYEQRPDGVWADVWYADLMTEQEKAAKQQETKDQWALSGFPSWVFDEETCSFNPPVPKPDDGKLYFWDEANLTWAEVPNA